MRQPITLVLLLIAANAAAAVYKWTTSDGSVIYSDQPPTKNATPADLPQVQEITIVPPPSSSGEGEEASSQAEASRGVEYTKLTITSPEDQAVLRENSGDVAVSIQLDPALQQGDKVAVILDGKEIGQGAGTTLTLSNVDRGTHTLQAAVKDADGKTLIESPTISFTVKRTSLLQPGRKSTP
jgi:hypothetical protein